MTPTKDMCYNLQLLNYASSIVPLIPCWTGFDDTSRRDFHPLLPFHQRVSNRLQLPGTPCSCPGRTTSRGIPTEYVMRPRHVINNKRGREPQHACMQMLPFAEYQGGWGADFLRNGRLWCFHFHFLAWKGPGILDYMWQHEWWPSFRWLPCHI